jgi:hypothetical protein
LVSLSPSYFMATAVKSEQPKSGDKRSPLLCRQATPGSGRLPTASRTRDTSPENKLDEIAGGDVKKTAQLALSPDTPYGDEVGKEGNKPCRDT